MKRSAELIGLPIMSIEEGIELGRVKDIIVHPQKKEINSLVIEDDSWWKESKIISFGLIRGIEETITVNNSSSVVTISLLPEVERLLENKVSVIDSNVITYSGKLIGKITEYFIDKRTGNIEAYLLTEQKIKNDYYGDLLLPKSCITTLGKKMVVVVDEIVQYAKKFEEAEKDFTSDDKIPAPTFGIKKENSTVDIDKTIAEVEELLEATEGKTHIIDDISQVTEDITLELKEEKIKKEEDDISKLISSLDEELEKKSDVGAIHELPKLPKENITETITGKNENIKETIPIETITAKEETPLITETKKEEAEDKKAEPEIKPVAEVKEESVETPKKPDFKKMFEERMIKNVLGKKATKKIIATDGLVIINEGEEVTEEIITKAKSHNKLSELAISAK